MDIDPKNTKPLSSTSSEEILESQSSCDGAIDTPVLSKPKEEVVFSCASGSSSPLISTPESGIRNSTLRPTKLSFAGFIPSPSSDRANTSTMALPPTSPLRASPFQTPTKIQSPNPFLNTPNPFLSEEEELKERLATTPEEVFQMSPIPWKVGESSEFVKTYYGRPALNWGECLSDEPLPMWGKGLCADQIKF